MSEHQNRGVADRRSSLRRSVTRTTGTGEEEQEAGDSTTPTYYTDRFFYTPVEHLNDENKKPDPRFKVIRQQTDRRAEDHTTGSEFCPVWKRNVCEEECPRKDRVQGQDELDQKLKKHEDRGDTAERFKKVDADSEWIEHRQKGNTPVNKTPVSEERCNPPLPKKRYGTLVGACLSLVLLLYTALLLKKYGFLYFGKKPSFTQRIFGFI